MEAGDQGRGAAAGAVGLARALPVAGLAAALCVLLLATTAYNGLVAGASLRAAGLPTSVRQLLLAACYAALAALSYSRPQALLGRRALAAASLVGLAGAAAFFAGHAMPSLALTLLGAALEAPVAAWALFVFACALPGLASLQAAALAVMGGILAQQFALPLTHLLRGALTAGADGLVVAAALVGVSAFLLATRRVRELSLPGSASLDELEVTNPLSRLRPPAPLFLGVFIISLAYRFGSAFGVPPVNAPRLAMVALMSALLYVMLVRLDRQEDRLFSLCVMLIMAGLLFTSLLFEGDIFASHTLLYLGSTCFTVLCWLIVYGVGAQNAAAAMPVFCMVECLDSLGSFAGGALGEAARAAAESGWPDEREAIVWVALAFFLCAWLAFRRFNFTDAVHKIESVDASAAETAFMSGGADGAKPDGGADGESADDAGGAGAAHAARCRELASSAGLTPREAEVLELLARGRNARFIMEELGVTRNTAKAHISHVYTKLGVHSHQELLTMLEERPDGRAA